MFKQEWLNLLKRILTKDKDDIDKKYPNKSGIFLNKILRKIH